ncbi:hypothetical protein JTE90_018701 [Oedothorax gibbosus]|uniref:Reverse transcriptase/retrotransposon-derived protein RNase H-like domain-containing protein n=1 Tax=Oedothorax gibbosus TaxID=931172 RepID=A0AAV6TYI2_9ARAC|nr:hypothetical protein JTE90_018701 [Oedothorax gibbosus]
MCSINGVYAFFCKTSATPIDIPAGTIWDADCPLVIQTTPLPSCSVTIEEGRATSFLKNDIPHETSNVHKWSLYAVEDVAIPARSAAKVKVVCRNSCHNFDVIVEENKNLLLRKEVALPSSIVTLHDGRGVVWITNGKSASQIVPAGMSIGVAEVLQKESINSNNTTHFAESSTPFTASNSTSSVDYLSMLAGDLTFDQKETLLKVFEDFSDIFDDSRKPQATRNTLKHRINTQQHPPVSQGAYRVSTTECQIIREEVTKMLKKGVVQPSESPWSSPVVLFCHKAQPLQELLKNNSKFVWGPEQETSFQKLKDVLIHDPVLGLYDGNAPIELHTDASGYELGAV